MAGNKKVLVLFTRSYPFGNGEEFIHEEVLQLSNYFEKIHIIPLEKTGKIRSIPLNHSIFDNGKIIQQKEDQNQIYYIQSKKLP